MMMSVQYDESMNHVTPDLSCTRFLTKHSFFLQPPPSKIFPLLINCTPNKVAAFLAGDGPELHQRLLDLHAKEVKLLILSSSCFTPICAFYVLLSSVATCSFRVYMMR
jgi:hypothetical protein